METATRGPSPESAVADPVAAPVTAPAAASSLTKPQDPILSDVQKANTPAERRALAERLIKEAQNPPAAKPAAQPPAEPEAPATDPATAPEVANPEAQPETTPETPPAEGEETVDDGLRPSIPTSKQLRLTLREDDKVGRLASAYQRRNRDWTLEQALEAARKELGVKAPDAAPTPETPKPNSDLPQDIAGVDAAILSLEEEIFKAAAEVRFEDQAKMQSKLRVLERHRNKLELDGEKQQTQAIAEYNADFSKSEAQASELYDFAGKPESEGGKRMSEIEADMLATGDPLYFAADKPLRIAQMVAREMNIAPKRKGAAPAPAKPAAPAAVATPVKPKSVLPGGSSRTVPATTTPANTMAQEISAAKTIAELRAVKKKYGFPDS